ncbi:MAG: ATP-binding cassette domain-containing protein [Bacteroidales bacterium]|jgi:phospholipid/cholesterol/gamma-HCH transport system ATP-binding protein|nr:ATP-binding cassette domain-containing protein [Bacteroidales bacterium]
MIEVQNVSKSFKDVQILKNVSTVFEEGKVNCIIGRSGSGKTVLMKSIVGLHEIDEGKILFHGRNYTDMTDKQRKVIRKEIGMVFQSGALFDSETLEDNVMFPLRMFSNMSEEECRERANFCLKRVEVINKNKLFPSEISGGMQKRVAIARAIALNPKYLLCDEPNSGLDPMTSIVIDNLLHGIVQEYNITAIVNTHDMNSVMEIADKIIFIYKGEKWWEGTKDEIWQTDNQEINDFIFASSLTKKIKQTL